MNPFGPFGNMMPYSNFHGMNLDWVIQIAKDFLDQYTHIQETITEGLEEINTETALGIEQLQEKADALEGALNAWYTEHSEDIAAQLVQAIADFQAAAQQAAQTAIASIPTDYTELSNRVTTLMNFAVQGSNTTLSDANKQSICNGSCDDLPPNKVYAVSGGVTLTNEPFTTYYGIMTIGKNSVRSAGDFQIATRVSDGQTKYRTYNNVSSGWSIWRMIPNSNLTFEAANTTITNDNMVSICNGDLDNLPNNTYYGVDGNSDVLHGPITNAFYCIATFGKYTRDSRSAGDFQIATNAQSGSTWIRTYYNTTVGWNPWKPIATGLVFTATDTTIDPTNKQDICSGDCNNIPNNTFYGVGGNADLTNEPFDNSFYSIATFGKYTLRSAGDIQLASRVSDNLVKIRTYYNDANGWSAWASLTPAFTSSGVISDSNKNAICSGDCNNIPNNTFYGVGGTTVLYNAPVTNNFYSISTFGKYTVRSAGDVQLASDVYRGILLYRNFINTENGWTAWKQIPETLTDESFYSGIEMFQRFGVIGDSFASGPILSGAADPLNQNFSLSWGQILAREVGITCVNYSEGGCGTYRFLDSSNRDYNTHLMGKVLADIAADNPCGLYLLCLGINDSASWREFGDKHGGLEYLGSSADIDPNDYTQNANSFWGNYGKIIAQLKAQTPDSRIVLCTYCRQNNSVQYAYNEYIQAIQQIAEYFNLPCITLTDDPFFNSSFYINNLVDNHPTAPQYVGYAKAINRLISRCIVDNINYFKVYTKLPE